jgi:hypothetical protein
LWQDGETDETDFCGLKRIFGGLTATDGDVFHYFMQGQEAIILIQ